MDTGQDQLLGALRHAPHGAQGTRLSRLAQVVEVAYAQALVEGENRARTDPRDGKQLEERARDLAAEPLQVAQPAGLGQLLELLGDGLTDARELRRMALPVGPRDIDRRALDGVGDPPVGDGLVHELALDLEEVADLVEDPGQLSVREGRRGSGGRGFARRRLGLPISLRAHPGILGAGPRVAEARRMSGATAPDGGMQPDEQLEPATQPRLPATGPRSPYERAGGDRP